MKFLNRNTLGNILIFIPMLLLLTSAFSKFFESESAVRMFETWGIIKHMRWISICEILISSLVIIPKTHKIGIFLLAIFMGGSMSIHLVFSEFRFIIVPFFILFGPIIGYSIKNNFEFLKKLFK
jgi:hypothetical protein